MKARFRMAERERFIQLSNSTKRCSLRGLTAGVGVNLRIEHEDVYVLTAGDDVVETAVTDVVRGRSPRDYRVSRGGYPPSPPMIHWLRFTR